MSTYQVFASAFGRNPVTVEPVGIGYDAAKIGKGTKEMNLHNALTTVSCILSGVGIWAELPPGIVPGIAPTPLPPIPSGAPSWSFVVLASIPVATLAIRCAYTLLMRYLESRERLAMISKGIAPPPINPAALTFQAAYPVATQGPALVVDATNK